MDLRKIVKKEHIIMDLKANTKDQALRQMIAVIEQTGNIDDSEQFLNDVYYRESLGITGIGNGISIPHGKSDSVKHTALVIGKSSTPIEWETLDDEPVHLVILFAVRNDDRETVHVRLLSKVATILGNDDACQEVMNTNSIEEVIRIFTEQD